MGTIKQKPLSENQQAILRSAGRSTGRVSAGRYGWKTDQVRALAKRGLVRLVSEHRWDSEWRLTPEGEAAARDAEDAYAKKARG